MLIMVDGRILGVIGQSALIFWFLFFLKQEEDGNPFRSIQENVKKQMLVFLFGS